MRVTIVRNALAVCRASAGIALLCQRSVAGKPSLDTIPLSVSLEIAEYRPGLLDTHLARTYRIHEVKELAFLPRSVYL
jgi:hypothetical protein